MAEVTNIRDQQSIEETLRTKNREQIREIANSYTWFHAIDFGDFQSCGRFPTGEPQNQTLFGVFDLLSETDFQEKDCLDIGTSDGLLAFALKTQGAGNVTAIDTYRLDSFIVARHLLGLDVDYLPRCQIKDMRASLSDHRFDLIACCGVIYHMLSPITAFTQARKLLKYGGLFIVETHYDPRLSEPIMVLNTESQWNPEPYTYWIPTRAAVEGMMRLCCFDVLAVRILTAPHRLAVMGRAVRPEEVNSRTDLCKKIHERDFADFEFRISDLDLDSSPRSDIQYHGTAFERTLKVAKFAIDFPPHPKAIRNGVGRTRWTTPTGNR